MIIDNRQKDVDTIEKNVDLKERGFKSCRRLIAYA